MIWGSQISKKENLGSSSRLVSIYHDKMSNIYQDYDLSQAFDLEFISKMNFKKTDMRQRSYWARNMDRWKLKTRQ